MRLGIGLVLGGLAWSACDVERGCDPADGILARVDPELSVDGDRLDDGVRARVGDGVLVRRVGEAVQVAGAGEVGPTGFHLTFTRPSDGPDPLRVDAWHLSDVGGMIDQATGLVVERPARTCTAHGTVAVSSLDWDPSKSLALRFELCVHRDGASELARVDGEVHCPPEE